MPPVVNPWLALPEGRPSPALTRRLRAAHERLVTGTALPPDDAVRSVVRDSWRRSLSSGVDPDGGTPPVELLDDDLLAYREAHPLAPVMPVIRRLLVEDAEADRMIVAVTDSGGRMLWVEGDARLRSQAAGMNFVEGARWAEEVAGTNAPGTALAVDHAVQIYGSEHYRRPVQPWSCSAAPVHDPVTGALLGAIDVTGGDHVASPHVLTLVRATVAAVESELRWQRREQLQRSAGRRPPPLQRVAPRLEVLGRDRARLTLPAGPVELSLRHSELLLLLAEAAVAGEGRTAAQLAAEVHRGEAAAVTVRAELSRLRRAAGRGPGRLPAVPAARPPRDRPGPGAPAAGPRLGRLGPGALPRRGAARVACARVSRARASGCRRCCARRSCAAGGPSCCSGTCSCPRRRTTSPSGRPVWTGCPPARRGAPRPPPTCCGCAGVPAPADHRRREWPARRRLLAPDVSAAPSTTDSPAPQYRPVVAAVVALALGGFAIGTTEFVTMGLLPDIAEGVRIDIPTAGHVISAYARRRRRGRARHRRPQCPAAPSPPAAGPDGGVPGRQRADRAGAGLRLAPGGPVPRRTAPRRVLRRRLARRGLAGGAGAAWPGGQLGDARPRGVQPRRGAGRDLARPAAGLADGVLGGGRHRPAHRRRRDSPSCPRARGGRRRRSAPSWARCAVPRCCSPSPSGSWASAACSPSTATSPRWSPTSAGCPGRRSPWCCWRSASAASWGRRSAAGSPTWPCSAPWSAAW